MSRSMAERGKRRATRWSTKPFDEICGRASEAIWGKGNRDPRIFLLPPFPWSMEALCSCYRFFNFSPPRFECLVGWSPRNFDMMAGPFPVSPSEGGLRPQSDQRRPWRPCRRRYWCSSSFPDVATRADNLPSGTVLLALPQVSLNGALG
jgi:hypothetical protein